MLEMATSLSRGSKSKSLENCEGLRLPRGTRLDRHDGDLGWTEARSDVHDMG